MRGSDTRANVHRNIKRPSAFLSQCPIKLFFWRQVPFPVTVSSALFPGQKLHLRSCRLETCVCGKCPAISPRLYKKNEPMWYWFVTNAHFPLLICPISSMAHCKLCWYYMELQNESTWLSKHQFSRYYWFFSLSGELNVDHSKWPGWWCFSVHESICFSHTISFCFSHPCLAMAIVQAL